jgi:N-acyl-D-amino-acid deacylase
VTLEVFGEGVSGGPLNEDMKNRLIETQSDFKYDVAWTTLDEYLEHLVAQGISPNIASTVGATTVRIHEIGYEDREPREEELARMEKLVDQAMRDGALGLSTSLIYAPAFYASTDEIVALAKVASRYDGYYVSHMRSEGSNLIEAIDELVQITSEADIRSEIFHLKASGQENWHKLEEVIDKVEAARAAGLRITADMYTYVAGSTGLDAAMPPWVQEGGYKAWAERLQDPEIRARLASEMTTPTDEWENLYLSAGAEGTLLVGFRNPDLRNLAGKTLAEVAESRDQPAWETAMDLVVEDGSRVQVVYFLMSEENVQRQIPLPWVSFGSDAASMATEGLFLETSTHPRAYGNFARLLGKYVRDERLLPMEEAIRKLTGLPAETIGVADRGQLAAGFFADVVVFDPMTIEDHATFDDPHQYSTGMLHVFVNGEQVLKDGEHTGALPGVVVRRAGWEPDGS